MSRPARVGRYRLESVLGAGGMALVYRGEDTRSGRSVAVKLLADNLAADTDLRKRFLREARIAMRLDHPNVVEVVDAGETPTRPYIVMELVDGSSLATVLARERRLDDDRAADVTVQLSAALAHAHARGVVHRDVKPANVLLSRDGGVKLADFGIARGLGDGTALTSTGSVLGTFAYLSPEQARGAAVGPASDIWSLGVLVAEMTSGVRPDSAQVQGVPTPGGVSGLPSRLGPVVARCLDHDPARRPSAEEVATLVLRSQEPTLARTRVLPPSADAPTVRMRPSPAPPRKSGRRRIRIGAATAAAAAAVVLVVAAVAADRQAGTTAPPAPAPQFRQESPRAQARQLSAWLRAHAHG